jgi:uncharacterized protein (DUF2252 family)
MRLNKICVMPGSLDRNRPVVIRELLPQDVKLELQQLTREETIGAERFLASVVSRAHASQMKIKTHEKWRAILRRDRSKTLAAPSWLGKSVVEFVSSDEAAYLEHCRNYAREAARQ